MWWNSDFGRIWISPRQVTVGRLMVSFPWPTQSNQTSSIALFMKNIVSSDFGIVFWEILRVMLINAMMILHSFQSRLFVRKLDESKSGKMALEKVKWVYTIHCRLARGWVSGEGIRSLQSPDLWDLLVLHATGATKIWNKISDQNLKKKKSF